MGRNSMMPWIPNLLRTNRGGSSLPSTGRTFLARLVSSLILDEGTGNPTWSRATAAWRFNENNHLRSVPSGCAVFGGARLVYNTVRTKSEDFSNAAWVKVGSITTPSANTMVCANATSVQYINQSATGGSIIVGNVMQYGIRVKKVVGGADYIQIAAPSAGFGTDQYVTLNLNTGDINAVGVTAKATLVADGTYDICGNFTCTVAGAYDYFVVAFVDSLAAARLAAFTGDGAKSVEPLRAWSCNVTGYASTYVPEYVSVGVVATPFFGAGIDGAKYFTTDQYGAPLSAASLLGFRRENSATNNLLWNRDFASGLTNRWVPSVSGAEQLNTGAIGLQGTATAATYNTGTGVGTVSRVDGSNQSYVEFINSTATRAVKFTIQNTGAIDIFVRPTGLGASLFSIPAGATVTAYATGYANYYITCATGTCGFTVTSFKISDMNVSLTATGLDGIANTATTLTATATDVTILQPITLASAARCASAYVRRKTGTGTISFTQDGGSTWTDITSSLNTSTFTRVEITSTLANPSVGFKISTSGDAIEVDGLMNEAGTVATSLILTTTAAVTRNAESLTYQTASNWSDTAGTVVCTVQPTAWSGGVIGSATNGLLLSSSNSGATAYDGTNAANGPAGTPSGKKKIALAWGGIVMKVASSGAVGAAGVYDGGMGLSTIGVGVNASCYVGDIAIYNYQMTDAEHMSITT
jgi:hypothetical protein